MVDQLDGKRVTSYQVDLKLTNLQTTREEWNGQKKIKKFQKRSKFGFYLQLICLYQTEVDPKDWTGVVEVKEIFSVL